MRLEPELWDALREICQREQVPVGELVRRAETERGTGGRTSAVRVYVLQYFREAAIEEGHARAGHGPRVRLMDHDPLLPEDSGAACASAAQ